jgi:hypothetical protein
MSSGIHSFVCIPQLLNVSTYGYSSLFEVQFKRSEEFSHKTIDKLSQAVLEWVFAKFKSFLQFSLKFEKLIPLERLRRNPNPVRRDFQLANVSKHSNALVSSKFMKASLADKLRRKRKENKSFLLFYESMAKKPQLSFRLPPQRDQMESGR